ncbi:uncharacterized protein EDB91DRAFT_1086134 [Suillus paluster]|uniref:uncharacterized protein n=1 Tax=Suillus paluster TaxID=48578 RepID=UPI001B87CBF2|nr:uncharacterized protein EDB91DRAFT_1086134 [Suillus paluster]KAG1728249.1 hypothetical protein EDB91DRAFT_1086134 [Suillus paluster]
MHWHLSSRIDRSWGRDRGRRRGQEQEQEQGDSHQILEDRQGQGQEQEQENSQSLEDRQGQEQEQEENSQSLEQVGVVHMRNILNKICQQRSKFSIKIHIPYGEHLVLQGQDHFAVDVAQEQQNRKNEAKYSNGQDRNTTAAKLVDEDMRDALYAHRLESKKDRIRKLTYDSAEDNKNAVRDIIPGDRKATSLTTAKDARKTPHTFVLYTQFPQFSVGFGHRNKQQTHHTNLLSKRVQGRSKGSRRVQGSKGGPNTVQMVQNAVQKQQKSEITIFI